jgi:hypothetical protein
MKKIHNPLKEPGVMKASLDTLKKLLTNIRDNPSEEKFRRLKMDNKAIDTKIMKITGG